MLGIFGDERYDALAPGTELHGYRLEGVLGCGSFGITYLAVHGILKTRHVIKEFIPDCAIREGGSTVRPRSGGAKTLFDWGLRSFFDEACLLHRLAHPNVVKVTDVFNANGTAYFVMPHIEGQTLQAWIEQHPSPAKKELEDVFIPLLEGLKYIHGERLLHRDIKPENVYIRDNGHPVLIDFGAARQAIGQESKTLTQVLTAHFAPIEQYSSKGEFTPALDIYSLAACMYLAIRGVLPDEAPERLMDDRLPKLAGDAKYETRYGRHFLAAIDKAMMVNAKQRFQSAFDFQKALLGLAEADSPPPAPSAEPPLPVPESDRRPVEEKRPAGSKKPLVAAVAALAIAGTAAFALFSPLRNNPSSQVATPAKPTAEELQKRKNRTTFDALVAKGREAIRTGQFDDAVRHLSAALDLDGFQDFDQVQGELALARDGADNTNRYRAALKSAEEYANEGQYAQAIQQFKTALLVPGHDNAQQALDGLRNAESEAAKAAALAQNKRYEEAMAEAKRHFDAGDYAAARGGYAKAAAVPGYADDENARKGLAAAAIAEAEGLLREMRGTWSRVTDRYGASGNNGESAERSLRVWREEVRGISQALEHIAALDENRAILAEIYYTAGRIFSKEEHTPDGLLDSRYTDFAQAFKYYRLAADLGHGEASYEYGRLLERGIVDNDTKMKYPQTQGKPDQAVPYYTQAANQNIVKAMWALGSHYYHDKENYKFWFEKAANLNDPNALEVLMCFYLNYHASVINEDGGMVCPVDAPTSGVKDIDKAIHYSQKLVAITYETDREYGYRQNRLGELYYEKGDFTNALRHLKIAGEHDVPGTAYLLKTMYEKGQGVQVNLPEAMKWLRKAAEEWHPEAQYELATRLRLGQDLPQDNEKALAWDRKAADQGHPGAQYNLGMAYATGRGVTQNPTEAVEWFRRAAEQGLPWAQNNLGIAYYNGEGVAQDQVESATWFRKAAEQGLADAQYNLATAYTSGTGIAKDLAEAKRWHRKAAEQGHAKAMHELGHTYHTWPEMQHDVAEARKWYKMAKDKGETCPTADALLAGN